MKVDIWKHGQHEHKNMSFGVKCMLSAVGSCLGHHNWPLRGKPPISCFQKVIRANKASIFAQVLGTFRRLCSLPLSLFTGSVLQEEEDSQESKRRNIENCLINDRPC